MDIVFAALSDATRRGMLARLCQGPASIGELGAPYEISKPAVSKHVRVLERAGLLERRRDGRIHRCRMNPQPMQDAGAWIEQTQRFWEDSLGALARYLEDTTPTAADSADDRDPEQHPPNHPTENER
ncbi:MAG: transcriptional regulator [Gemmatimonadota bacterium]|nr:MAG: transcriptional regulator [Gemmatimonadota bacterium]